MTDALAFKYFLCAVQFMQMIVKIAYRHMGILQGLGQIYFLLPEIRNGSQKFCSVYLTGAAETDAFLFCGGNAFRLPGPDVFPFVFGNKGEDLQNDV